MKKNLLGCALLGVLGVAHAAVAQEFDDRWYVSGTIGFSHNDGDRNVGNSPVYGLGVGKFFSPNFSLDLDLNTTNPEKNGNNLHWNNYGAMLTGRHHFRAEDRTWWPYVAFGAGVLRTNESYPAHGGPFKRKDNNLAAQLGVGLQADYARHALRAEVLGRYNFDDQSVAAPREDSFLDVLTQVSFLYKLGAAPAAPVEPVEEYVAPPAQPTCADLDDDGDGVNNCEDRCPNSQPGQTIGPDGCPVAVTIDLRGVNFDFDKATLRPDAVETLNEAVAVLKQYPEMRVEVAGHTDLCGAETYNQSLSERRAKAVYDYLATNGIGASRLVGPNGYGESRPLEPTAQNLPGCKSELNRRTELNVQ
ncbi:OmpA family protein [Xanthomonadaceae bacterium JHOS43]|nr:OmpA family protein [Xanthomonadaceae bacterium JHOS43]MCX7563147.1 OmpA family protein [Xanthomonadaceae bacterium XH05]